MKVLYIESKLKNQDIRLSKQEIAKLPKKIFLAYTIQYKETAEQVKKQLQANKIIITGFQQILGCSKVNTKDPILYIGTGKFHYMNLLLQSPAIYIIAENKITGKQLLRNQQFSLTHQIHDTNPIRDLVIKQIPKQEIELQRNKRYAAYAKYLRAVNIGILVSTKPGQENLSEAIKLKARLKKQGKNSYIFLGSNIDINQFENFHIDSWVNTACQGLSYDNSNLINSSELSNE